MPPDFSLRPPRPARHRPQKLPDRPTPNPPGTPPPPGPPPPRRGPGPCSPWEATDQDFGALSSLVLTAPFTPFGKNPPEVTGFGFR